jgi:hypothetical protein
VKIENFFADLKRRNVYRVAIAYAVVSWLLIQVATQVFPFFEIPNWAIRLVIMLLALGFPIALVLAWAFELTPEGIRRMEAAKCRQLSLAEALSPATGSGIGLLEWGSRQFLTGREACGSCRRGSLEKAQFLLFHLNSERS